MTVRSALDGVRGWMHVVGKYRLLVVVSCGISEEGATAVNFALTAH